MKSAVSRLGRLVRLGWCIGGMAMAAPSAAQVLHGLQGRIWDVRTQQFMGEQALYQRAAAARYVLLGEKHDSAAHHARQLAVLQGLAVLGAQPALAMEQLDSEHQTALAQAQGHGPVDADTLANAGQLNRQGWRWPLYKDLIAFAATRQWPVRAANLSRTEARRIALGEVVPALPAATAQQQAALEDDVVQGHCGRRPEPARLAATVLAQRARDARMAQVLDAAGGGPVVLIAGAGHVRSDRAVPRYLAEPGKALSIGLLETVDPLAAPSQYDLAGFDVVWFTAPTERPDMCATPLPGLAAPATPSSSPTS